ncbi:MAG: transglutaminase-like domain-containing protein, partial [bacterium]
MKKKHNNRGNISLFKPFIILCSCTFLFSCRSQHENQINLEKLYKESKSFNIRYAHDRGLCLYKNVLVEDDGPSFAGAPQSSEELKSDIWIRKDLLIPDPVCEQAWLVICFNKHDDSIPLVISINGQEIERGLRARVREGWSNLEIPKGILKQGINSVIVHAQNRESNWSLNIARKDKYAQGTLTRAFPGRSYKSLDSGKTWSRNNLGKYGHLQGEYPVRINLVQYAANGWLISPVMNVWAREGIMHQALPRTLDFLFKSNVPAKTKVNIYYKISDNISLFPGMEWTPHMRNNKILPSGLFFQFKIEMYSKDGNTSPEISFIKLQPKPESTGKESPKITNLEIKQPLTRTPYYDFKFDDMEHPKLKILRQEFGLEEFYKKSKDVEMKLIENTLNWSRTRFEWQGGKNYEYIDAVDILNGGGGMCTHYSMVFQQGCEAVGLPCRLASINHGKWGHEVNEVWCDTFGKWIALDATKDEYFIRKTDKIPM